MAAAAMGERAGEVIAVCFLTYWRPDYAVPVLHSLAEHLQSSEPIWLHIADDGSPQPYRDHLLEIAHDHWGDNVSVTNSERRGYGANFNFATQLTHQVADVVLPCEDDWLLTRPLDLDPLAAAVRSNPLTQCIRLGYLGFTQEIRGTLICAGCKSDGSDVYLALDPDSPERHVMAGHPRLESVAWEKEVGLWPEGLDPNKTEWEVCAIPAARQGVAWPLWMNLSVGSIFSHIGTERARD